MPWVAAWASSRSGSWTCVPPRRSTSCDRVTPARSLGNFLRWLRNVTLGIVIWVRSLGERGMVPCGVCDREATCVLHSGSAVSTSSMVRFVCGHHVRKYLESKPEYTERLLHKMGAQGLCSFYEPEPENPA